MIGKLLAGLACTGLVGCASTSDKIGTDFVPTSTYAGASCDDLARDTVRLQQDMTRLGVAQDRAAQSDRQAMMAAFFVTWPALFFLKGDQGNPSLARARGEFVALRQAAVAKGCIPATELSDPRFVYTPPLLPKADDVGTADRRRR